MRIVLAVVLAIATPVLTASQPAAGTRRIVLEGAANLRDLGGYATSDGQRTRWGRVFRSDHLAELTDRDYQAIAALGIGVVCDFRTEAEQKLAPTAWKGAHPPKVLTMPAAPMPAGVPEPFAAVTKNSSAAEVAAALRNTYAWYPLRFAESYGRMFNLIITDGLPVLFHCTAGKDRAGMFAAALLTVLGVPKDIVIADYLLSNDYYGTEERLAQLAKQYGLSLGATRALFGVERSYLEASFDAIDREYGSFDQYRRKALGLSDERLALLKARLLERAAR